jgi:serine/threonine protein kinase
MVCKHAAVMPLVGWNLHPFVKTWSGDVPAFVLISPFIPHALTPGSLDLSATEKMIVLYGIARAMKYLHSLKVAHRDLKPANIRLDEHKRPIVCDFGVAKNMTNREGQWACGTHAYMAPEIRGRLTGGHIWEIYIRAESCFGRSPQIRVGSL